ncbi:hypothetical protein B0H13DRAFT_1595040, partial [Mycena leptocephala]
IVFSKFPKPITLRDLPGYYGLIHRYLSTLWRDKMILYSDVSGSVPMGGAIFNGVVLSFSHILVNGRRFGAMTRPRGRSAQYGYIEDRMPVQIQYILRAIQPRSGFADCVADFAVVRRFQTDQNMIEFPWALRATDLGVQTWYADKLGPPEVVSLPQLMGHFILAWLEIGAMAIWVTVAFDHVGQTAFLQ